MCFSDKGEGNLDVFGVNRYSHIWEMEKDGRMATSPSIAHLISDSTLNGHTATPTALSCAGSPVLLGRMLAEAAPTVTLLTR